MMIVMKEGASKDQVDAVVETSGVGRGARPTSPRARC